MTRDDGESRELRELRLRVELLEEENQRLRESLTPFVTIQNPAFNAKEFTTALGRALIILMIPTYLIGILMLPMFTRSASKFSSVRVGPFALIDFGGTGTRHPGIGIGIIGIGGLGAGLVGIGGLGVGVIAMGGGAIGLIAIGGGSAGLIAAGGGAVGYIAVGGGAIGYYSLGQRARGKYALGLNRQDDEAVELFCRWVPGLRSALTRPMPVLPVDKSKSTGAARPS